MLNQCGIGGSIQIKKIIAFKEKLENLKKIYRDKKSKISEYQTKDQDRRIS